jgi:protein SCO1/2
MILSKQICLIASLAFLVACNTPVTKEKPAAGKLPFYNSADFTPQWIEPTAKEYAAIHTIPSFQFTDQNGETVTDQTFEGKIYVADFFFTACPGICKRLTTHLTIVQDSFKTDNRVLLLSHSVTPESDSVPRLKQYANSFGVINGKWHLVTGERNALYNIARQSYFADEDMGQKKNSSDFLHTENMLLIDTHRRIRGVYKGTALNDINNLIADIKILEKEK